MSRVLRSLAFPNSVLIPAYRRSFQDTPASEARLICKLQFKAVKLLL